MNKRNIKNRILLKDETMYRRKDESSMYEDMEYGELDTMWTRLFRIYKTSPMFNNKAGLAIKYRLTDGTYFYIATNYSSNQWGNPYCNTIKVVLESTPSRKRTTFTLMDFHADTDHRRIFNECLSRDHTTLGSVNVLGEIEDFIEDYLIYKN